MRYPKNLIMRSYLVALLLLFSSAMAFGQSPLTDGGAQLNFGVGLNGDGVPLYFGGDVNIANNVTLGAQGSYTSDRIGILGNLNYHFDEIFEIPSEWNVYAGANAGIYLDNDNNNNNNNDKSTFGFGLQIGGRYFFNDKWAVNLEVGGGNVLSGGKLGATFKL